MITEASKKANKLHIMHAAKLLSKMSAGHEKENAISEKDKILLYKLYIKLKNEFTNLDKDKL